MATEYLHYADQQSTNLMGLAAYLEGDDDSLCLIRADSKGSTSEAAQSISACTRIKLMLSLKSSLPEKYALSLEMLN